MIARRPDDPMVVLGYTVALARQARLSEAHTLLELATKRWPDHAQLAAMLSRVREDLSP